MSDPTTTTRPAGDVDLRARLRGARLPRWAPYAAGAAAVVLAFLLAMVTGIEGWGGTATVAVLLFLVGLTSWSFLVEGRRHAVDRLATTLVYATFVIAVVPLVAVLFSVIQRGISALNLQFLVNDMRNVSPRAVGGGIAHALVGTIEQVLIATVIAVPIGVLAAIYLVEYGGGRLAKAVSFFVDVMTGVPSIVAGLFVYTGLVLTLGLDRSGFAAALSLVVLMIPVITRTTEEMLKIVPNDLREASYALGVPKWRTILRVVIPTALGGIVTGVMLAVARVAGETAPLLLTTFLSQNMNWNPFSGPQASLPLFVWSQIGYGTDAAIARAWAGALVLILFVVVMYVSAKLVARRFAPKAR
ncbi:MAG: phosphate ABC transporter permease PstA [Candidatus Nanopelagicales bacterium]